MHRSVHHHHDHAEEPAPAIAARTSLRDRPVAERMESAVAELINTRQCCGDEIGALQEFESEFGTFSPAERKRIRSDVEAQWRGDQAAAGVTNPIGHGERARINRALEDDDREPPPRFEGWGDSNRWGDD